MAEAGPSSSAQRDTATTSATSPTSTPSSTIPKHSRIHFPQDSGHGKFGSTRSHSSAEMAALGLGRPPLSRRVTPGTEGNGPAAHVRNGSDDTRPRVKSVDVHLGHVGSVAYGGHGGLAGSSRLRTRSEFTGDARKFPSAVRKSSRKDKMRADLPDAAASYSTPATSFSDEYDLAHEDPRIIEDVQRAIKLKARREARIRALQSVTSKDTSSLSDAPSGSSISHRSSPLRSTFGPICVPPPIVPPSTNLATESEVDFSPSVGGGPASLHPVPSSSNGGATLDWTGSISDDEKLDRRWSISMKRKNKDKTPVPNRSTIEKQDSIYIEKLSHIRSNVKVHTLRKVEITREQLERRYSALIPPTSSSSSTNTTNTGTPINLLTVAKWYNSQDAVVQTALDKSEPLSWLKHLLHKDGREHTSRFPWHLTALIMEEYVRSKTRPDTMETIPEDDVMEVVTQTPPHLGSVGHSENKSPSSGGSWSYPASLEPSLSRRKTSQDGQVSFEPQVDSGRDSIGGEEFRASIDHGGRMRNDTYSPRSSINSSIFYGRVNGLSPNNSRLHFRDLASRLKRKPYPGSDDGLSSARNSISEQSQEEDPGYRSHSPRLKTPRRTNLVLSRSQPGSDDERKLLSAEPSDIGDLNVSSGGEGGPMTARQPSYSIPSSPQPASSPMTSPKPPSQSKRLIPRLARKRASLPTSPRQLFIREKEKQQRHADEEQERREYDRKNELLEGLMRQNWRTRQILHKVGANIREYENVQKSLAASLGVQYTSIPQEVLDALNHDPCSVVTGTKRFKSWRAVDDIYSRIVRQRDVLRNFARTTAGDGIATPSKSVFADSIAGLTDALQQLEVHRQHIIEEAATVADALVRVKDIHATVKREYNETMAHTSLVYPELSQIITLEESYRNHYQQLWNIGLDALTLLLDTVTPFWRNYGKVIGEDVQDFLIIPWYRNEFTGEAKRYPIKSFPRRSFRHWVGLLIFYALAILVTMLQIRAAWSSTLNYNLPWLADTGFRWMFVPMFGISILVQWVAVLVELAIVFAIFGIVVWWLGWVVKLCS